jgi:hypothetical protein
MASNEEIADFVRTTFRSVWALELLILLRQDPGRALTTDEMVAALRGSQLVVAQSVEMLAAAGLILADPEGAAHYAPAAAGTEALVAETERLYARSPNAVRRMIVAAANPGASAFADAFRLRKDRGE